MGIELLSNCFEGIAEFRNFLLFGVEKLWKVSDEWCFHIGKPTICIADYCHG